MPEPVPNNHRFTTSAGEFELVRYPSRKEEPLKAWNSADRLLIEQVLQLNVKPATLLVVNDDHGALSTALQPVALWTDSALSTIAVKGNCLHNSLGIPAIISSVESPPGSFSVVAMKVPKQLPYFEYQLARLSKALSTGAVVVAAGMDKHLSSKVAGMLERYIGPTTRHPGKSKARCFSATRSDRVPASDYHSSKTYFSELLDGDLLSLPNVFSREKMDGGSRLIIESFAKLEPVDHAIDLACGNGILGLTAFKLGLCNSITMCDESAMAVESAAQNASNLMSEHAQNITTHHGDGLLNIPAPRAELIVCNPPFHANHTVEEYVGKRLLMQCADYLGHSGKLCLVANRHLNYLPSLKRGFSRVDKLSDNGKFIVWLAKK